jgi:succinate-semialdehyde dehydrogenase / glutarate-semialdehyde dehydrogenase
MSIVTTNPATGERLEEHRLMDADEVERAIQRAHSAFESWRRQAVAKRAAPLRSAARILRERKEQYGRLMAKEMGKVLREGIAEAEKCAIACEYYAEHAAAFLQPELVETDARRSYVSYQPLGVILAIMPWNFPFWQVFRFAAPALAAGNVALLKHAPNVPGCARTLEEIFREAGFPEDTFQSLLVDVDAVPSILDDPRVRAATLTGSPRAGSAVAERAGARLKKTVLELGGSDPFVVMPSADLERAAAVATTSRCQNNGQSCIAAKRFIVHTDVYDEFAELFVAKMSALVVGDPMAEGTDVGPLATASGRDEVDEQVRDAQAHGARVLCGGQRPDRPGWWYPPTVVAELTPRMRVWSEEVFGPVAGLFRVSSYQEAVELANETTFGLGSNAWTRDPAEQEGFIADLAAGAVFINGMTTSYPSLPFGGIKDSGYGRELSAHGMREFCNLKTVWVG